MRLGESAGRRYSPTEPRKWLATILLVILSATTQPLARTQQQIVASDGKKLLTATQVVEGLVEMNLRRAQALHSYHGQRIYRVEYRGLLGARSADMVVDVTYTAPETKNFTILSSTGSTLMIDKVLKKLLQAETEAASAEGQRRTALNSENYDFTLVAENTAPRLMYVLALEPKTKNKFLFRGRIWVDAADFAVVRLEAERPGILPSGRRAVRLNSSAKKCAISGFLSGTTAPLQSALVVVPNLLSNIKASISRNQIRSEVSLGDKSRVRGTQLSHTLLDSEMEGKLSNWEKLLKMKDRPESAYMLLKGDILPAHVSYRPRLPFGSLIATPLHQVTTCRRSGNDHFSSRRLSSRKLLRPLNSFSHISTLASF